jgi:hypothetical protein
MDTLDLRQLTVTDPGWAVSTLAAGGVVPSAAPSLDPGFSLAPNMRAALFFYLHPRPAADSGVELVDLAAGPLAHFHGQGRPGLKPDSTGEHSMLGRGIVCFGPALIAHWSVYLSDGLSACLLQLAQAASRTAA